MERCSLLARPTNARTLGTSYKYDRRTGDALRLRSLRTSSAPLANVRIQGDLCAFQSLRETGAMSQGLQRWLEAYFRVTEVQLGNRNMGEVAASDLQILKAVEITIQESQPNPNP
ncbi:unnamed protein product [Arctia plantaginis]|uniref:Uncharacterized protein n=1 Tax=Arctia plantaginis TaxID=874455 RepID=A0A8S0ZGR4_ARCPL|nr:unnamed protein product [Arctia plantaginis]